MHPMLQQLFHALDEVEVRYCVLRDAEHLETIPGGEVDVLVAPADFVRLRTAARKAGFAPLPSWGYTPHHFFAAYDPETDCWFKLDVVTELAYGRSVKVLRTGLGARCLERRRRVGVVWAPSPEDEIVALLLHEVLDKGRFDPARAERLQGLCNEVEDADYLDALLAAYWLPGVGWGALRAQIAAGEWDALLAAGSQVAARLRRRDPLVARTRGLRNRALRRLNRWTGLLRPSVPSVAVLGPDGAGKSTLADGIQAESFFPVRRVYMGLYQKKRKRSVKWLPGLGFVQLLLTQWARYVQARAHQASGRLVIFDRYAYDAMLPAQKRLSAPRRLRRWLLAHTCPPPDLVLLLDAPAEMLFARKGEHTVEILEHQRQAYLSLQDRLPQMAVVDATQNAETTRRAASALIWQTYLRRSG